MSAYYGGFSIGNAPWFFLNLLHKRNFFTTFSIYYRSMAIVKADQTNFQELIQNHSKVIVKFYAAWCGSCKLLAPKFKKLSEQTEYQDIVFLDIDAEVNPEIRKSIGVNNLPFIATFQNARLVEGVPTSNENYIVQMLQKLQ